MPRKRLHATPADRCRAYRRRLRERLAGLAPPQPRAKAPRRLSRPQRLAAIQADVEALADEYRAWREGMPENLADSALAGQLDETVEQLEEALEKLNEIEPPRGFGR